VTETGWLPYDMVLPPPPDPREAGEWRAWRSAGGNLVTEEGRKVPWPPRTAIEAAYPDPGPFGSCYKTATGMAVHVRPGCRCKA
jgi:hypothetical protein